MKLHKIFILALLLAGAAVSCDDSLDLLTDDPRDAFTGTWSVMEDNTLKSVEYYTVSIDKYGIDTTEIRIKNFYAIGTGTSVVGIVDGDKVNLPTQTVSGFTIQGYGVMTQYEKKIDWSYSVDYNDGFTDAVTATFTKP